MHVNWVVKFWLIVHVTHCVHNITTDAPSNEDVEYSYVSANVSYTTSEMREMCLDEWKGKTQEVQNYFDQLPSEEFKENSEDLKFKLYYERKGLKDVDTNQVFNITPKFAVPLGPEYTIEVNDSYVPKYRVTTSEERRMEEYGTFNTISTSSETSKDEKSKPKDSSASESSETGTKLPKKKKDKKKWPSNMDPKKKKKRSKTDEKEKKKRKDLVERTINGVGRLRLKGKEVKNVGHLRNLDNKNIHNIKAQANRQGYKPLNAHVKQSEFRYLNSNKDKIQNVKDNILSKNNLRLQSTVNAKETIAKRKPHENQHSRKRLRESFKTQPIMPFVR